MKENASLLSTKTYYSNPKAIALITGFRDLAFAGIVLISLVPETSNRFLFVTFFSMWIFFAYASNVRAFIKTLITPDIKIYSVYIWLMTYVIFYFTGYIQGAEIDRIFNHVRLGFTLLIFNYYLESEDWKAIEKLTGFSLACIVASCILTLRGIALDPMAARILATGREELIMGFDGLMIGTYGLIYSLAFVAVTLIGLLKMKKSIITKTIFLGMALLFSYTIFSAAFMIALLILLVGFLLIFLNIKNTLMLIVTSFILVFLALLLSPLLYATFSYLGAVIEHDALSMRFYELAHMVRYGTAEGTVTSEARFNLYWQSLTMFLENPILGIGGFYGFRTDLFGIGGHSTFLDELAKYGILGSGFLFVAIISNFRYVYGKLRSEKQRAIYFSVMILFCLLGFINTLLFVPIFFTMFFVVPGMIFSYTKHGPKEIAKR
jgi:O-antigen ligase